MAIPGMRGMEHIGFTVPDINEACDFFEKILGAETLYTAAKDFRGEGNWMKDHLNVDPRCVIKEFRYMRCGNGTNLEVFQYEAPDQVKIPLKIAILAGIISLSMSMIWMRRSNSLKTMASKCWASPPLTPMDLILV